MNDDPDDVQGLRAALARQRRLAERLRGRHEAERTAVSRAVHDTIGQTLSAMKMQLHEMRRGRGAAERLPEQLDELESHIDTLLALARRIASDMRPGVLDHFGLASALNATLDRFEHEHGIAASFEQRGNAATRLATDIEIGLLRIVELALENVAQHAAAKHVAVAYTAGDGVDIDVRDDGRGFDPSALDPDAALDLLDMASRAQALGATLDVDSAPGRGTRVHIKLPAGIEVAG